jgi:uncharacterized protein with PIN domain
MKLLLTKELGRLAKWLRILGFDAEYFSQDKASSLIIKALREDRLIITRNHHLPAGRGVRIIVIESERLREQIPETLKELNIHPDKAGMFTRCIICNMELVEVDKSRIKDKVPEYVFKTQEDFITCPKCGRVYWQGTHWGNVQQTLEGLV